MQNMIPVKMHSILKPLCWLVGTWKTVYARTEYPSKLTNPRPFKETVSFKSLGQPQLKFDALSWNTKTLEPFHIQNGYMYLDKSGHNVILVTAHNNGYAIVESGTVKECTLKLDSVSIGHSELASKRVIAIRRVFSLNENGQLVYKMMLQTEDEHNLFNHLKAVYEKDSSSQNRDSPFS